MSAFVRPDMKPDMEVIQTWEYRVLKAEEAYYLSSYLPFPSLTHHNECMSDKEVIRSYREIMCRCL